MTRILPGIVLGLLLAGWLTACDSNPVSDDHDEHADEIHALQLVSGGDTLVVWTEDAGLQSGAIEIDEGADTDLITVEFFTEEGEEVHSDELSDEFELELNIGDATVAQVAQPADAGRWSFLLHGLQAGSTSMELALLHAGHEDLTVREIPVTVVEVN